MYYPKFILYYQEYNHQGEAMDMNSWDDFQYYFDSEEELKSFINNKLEFLFRVKAIYRLDENILKNGGKQS